MNHAYGQSTAEGPETAGSAGWDPARGRWEHKAWAQRGSDPPCADAGGLHGVDEQGAEAAAL